MAKVYKNMSIYITDSGVRTKKYCGSSENKTVQELNRINEDLNLTDAELHEKYGPAYGEMVLGEGNIEALNDSPYEITSETLDLPFLPEELEIKFDGNNAEEYLANGDFYIHKRKPKPKTIEINSFFPGKESKRQLHRTVNLTKKWNAQKWMEYFNDLMDTQRTINLCFTKWNFTMDCVVNKFYPKIKYGEVNDIYYVVEFIQAKDPIISPILTLAGQGHNSWITRGEWQLIGGSSINIGNMVVDPSTLNIHSGDNTTTKTTTANDNYSNDKDREYATMVKTTQKVLDGKISKNSIVKVKGDYTNTTNVSMGKSDIDNPTLRKQSTKDLQNIGAYLFGGGATYKNVYDYIQNGGTWEVLKVIDYSSIAPKYDTIIYQIKTKQPVKSEQGFEGVYSTMYANAKSLELVQ